MSWKMENHCQKMVGVGEKNMKNGKKCWIFNLHWKTMHDFFSFSKHHSILVCPRKSPSNQKDFGVVRLHNFMRRKFTGGKNWVDKCKTKSFPVDKTF